MTEDEDNQIRKLIDPICDKFVADIREHCQSVQVFITFETDDANSGFYSVGKGCWHARVGMARQFLIRDDEIIRDHVRTTKDEE